MNFGLAQEHHAALAAVFARHPSIRRVLIYGSRARGEARPASDFDLAVEAPGMTESEFSRLWNEIQEVPLVFKVDLLHLDRLTRPELAESIRRDGKVFYPCDPF